MLAYFPIENFYIVLFVEDGDDERDGGRFIQ
jgi:hypothetical protein